MEASVRHLTEARIRELLAGMPTFNEKIRKLGRSSGPALPSAEDYPAASSLADVVAHSLSDDPEEVAFYQDVMRLQELWTYVNALPGSARGRIDAAIASLRLQTAQVMGGTTDEDMAALFRAMISSRIEQLESVTDEELSLVARFAPEVEQELFHRAQGAPRPRRARSASRSRKRKDDKA